MADFHGTVAPKADHEMCPTPGVVYGDRIGHRVASAADRLSHGTRFVNQALYRMAGRRPAGKVALDAAKRSLP
jgi:hypothetical protein